MMPINNARLVYAVFLIVGIYCAFGVIWPERVFAAVNQTQRPEEELLILEFHVNGTIRNSGIIGYLPQGENAQNTLFPISAFSRALSYAIKANPTEGIADGWFGDEKNVFQLDLTRNTVFVKNQDIDLAEDHAEAHFDDIYVRAHLLEEWFNIKLNIDISTLRLFATKDTPFPFEEEIARKQRGESISQRRQSGNIPEYDPESVLPYQWWHNPSIVWQKSINARSNQTKKSGDASFSVQANMDALKSSAKFTLSGSTGTDRDTKIDNAQLTFQKRDPGNNLLGPLKAGRVEVGDISYPDVPLIVGQKRGRGVSVSSDSNFNFARSFSAEQFDIEGEAPIGWDAELYRNGYFVAFQEIDIEGRYDFESIDLVKGFNLFQIILYGPEGQKRIETKRVVRGQELLREGQFEYDMAAGQPDADFIPIAREADNDTTFGGSARVAYGIKDYLTVSTNVFTGQDDRTEITDRISAFGTSAVAAFLGLKTQAQYMKANEGRSAYNIDTTTQILGANISAGHKKYAGFSNQERELKSTTDVSINKNLGLISTNIRAEKNRYRERETEDVVSATISASVKGVRFTNSLDRTFSKDKSQEDFEGDLTILANAHDWRLRSNLAYDLESGNKEKLRTFDVSAFRSIDKKRTIRLNSQYNFVSNFLRGDLRYTQQFDKYSLDFNAGASTQNNHYVGVTFRTGFQPDHEGNYQMVSAKEGGLGSVGLRAFLDENGNNKYDKGEKPLQNIGFRTNRGAIDGETDSDGSLFVNGLAEGITRFELDEASLPSIYIKPYKDYIEIIPRSGTTTTIDIGFEQLGEIDGFVHALKSNGDKKPMPGIEVILIDTTTGEEVSSISSEYDGYYIFSAIPLGTYIVKAIPLWDDAEGEENKAHIVLENGNSIKTDANIIVPYYSEPDVDSVAEHTSDDVTKIEPAAGEKTNITNTKTTPKTIPNVTDDTPKPVVTDGRDVATGEALRGLFIHIGSLQDFDAAQKEQKRIYARYADILGQVPVYIYKINTGGKIFYRIVGKVNDREKGDDLCSALRTAEAPGGCSLAEL